MFLIARALISDFINPPSYISSHSNRAIPGQADTTAHQTSQVRALSPFFMSIPSVAAVYLVLPIVSARQLSLPVRPKAETLERYGHSCREKVHTIDPIVHSSLGRSVELIGGPVLYRRHDAVEVKACLHQLIPSLGAIMNNTAISGTGLKHGTISGKGERIVRRMDARARFPGRSRRPARTLWSCRPYWTYRSLRTRWSRWSRRPWWP